MYNKTAHHQVQTCRAGDVPPQLHSWWATRSNRILRPSPERLKKNANLKQKITYLRKGSKKTDFHRSKVEALWTEHQHAIYDL